MTFCIQFKSVVLDIISSGRIVHMPKGLQFWVPSSHFDQCLVSGQCSQGEQHKPMNNKLLNGAEHNRVQSTKLQARITF